MKRILLFSIFFLTSTGVRADICTGLVGWWKFDEGAGTTALDSSSNSHTATLHSAPSWVAGHIGSHALSFNGSSQYGDIGTYFNYTTSFTVACWVKATDVTQYGELVGTTDGNDADGGWELYIIGIHSGAAFNLRASSGFLVFSSALSNNTWYHVAGVYDSVAGTDTLYVNGVVNGTPLSSVFANTSSFHAQMGARPNSTLYFGGSIDDVRIYNRALSSSDIAELYNYTSGNCFVAGINNAVINNMIIN